MTTAVLIHGAWQGSWSWDRLVPRLNAEGIATIAVDLPGNGTDTTMPQDVSLALYVRHVLGVLTAPSVLIAHSGGGIVASAVAEAAPELVTGIVYIAGMMLPDGMGFADLIAAMLAEDPAASGIGPHLVWSADRLTSTVPPHAALHFFLHDCDPSDAAAAAQRLTPQPEHGRAVRANLTAARFGRVRRLYVEATQDRSVVPSVQRRMQALAPGAEVVRIATGHVPMLADPERLVHLLIPFLRGLG